MRRLPSRRRRGQCRQPPAGSAYEPPLPGNQRHQWPGTTRERRHGPRDRIRQDLWFAQAPTPETGFEHGISRFGYLLMEVPLLLGLAIFAIKVALHRPVLDSFLFSVANAVGLTPQLRTAIISVKLAHGARRMARQRVIVRRLASIENLGGKDVLCSDKTGTRTKGKVPLHAVVDVGGQPCDRVGLYACLNASLQWGYPNPIDAAIVAEAHTEAAAYYKLDEEPYDFIRKRLCILVAGRGKHVLLTKGAMANVLDICTTAESGAEQRGGVGRPTTAARAARCRVEQPGLASARCRRSRHGLRDRNSQGPRVGDDLPGATGPRRPAPRQGRRNAPEAPPPRHFQKGHSSGTTIWSQHTAPARPVWARGRSSLARFCGR